MKEARVAASFSDSFGFMVELGGRGPVRHARLRANISVFNKT